MMQLFKSQIVKRLLLLVVALAGVSTAFATSRLYIEDFSIDSYGEVTVPIMLDSDKEEATQITWTLELPAELTFVDAELVRNDAYGKHTLSYRGNRFSCTALSTYTIQGLTGTFVELKLKPADGILESPKTVNLSLKNISIANADGNEVTASTEETTAVSFIDKSQVIALSMSASEEQFLINPSGTHTVTLSLDNEKELGAFKFRINLPEGFKVIEEPIHQTSRINGDAPYYPSTGNVVIAGFSNPVISGLSGELVSFDVVAPADFSAETATIVIDGVNGTPVGAKYSSDGTGCSIKVVNGKTAYDKALAEIQSLRDELTDALAEIATAAPDVKDDFTGAEISTAIDNLATAIDEAYADLTLTDNYNDVLASAAGISAAIDKLVTDAKAAQSAHDATVAEDAAKAKADAETAALDKALADALATIAAEAADVKDNFSGAEIATEIQALKDAVNAAYAESQLAAKYDEILAPVEKISAEIDALVADAKAAQAAYEAEQTAKANADAETAALDKALADALATIAAEAADVKDNFSGAEIATEIQALKDAVNAAYAESQLAEKYDEILAPAEKITAEIEALLADAKAAQAAYEAEQTAKANADAETAALDKALADALATIAAEAADVKDNFSGAEIATEIQALKDAVNAAYAESQLAEKYDEILAPVEKITAEIDALVADAKAAQAAYEAEQDRKAANEKAYNDDLSTLDALQAKLDAAKAELATLNPGYDSQSDVTTIQALITAARLDAKMAYDKVATEGVYEYTLDAAAIETAIDGLYLKSAQAQVNALNTELKTALDKIAAECPNVKALFPGTEIATAIDDLKAAAEAAAADGTLPANYAETVNTPTARIEADIEKLIADAKAAQEEYNNNEELRKAANEAAYKADIEALDALQKRLDAAKAELATLNPEYDSQSDVTTIQALITAARLEAKTAYEKVATEGSYEYTLDADGINAMIDAMYAKSAQAQVAELNAALDAALKQIATECPNVKEQFPGTEIATAIDDLKAAAEAAAADGTLPANYAETVNTPTARIEADIEKLIADAKAAQEEYETNEELRQAANEAAHKADIEKLDRLQQSLDQTLEEIAAEYPGYDSAAYKEAIQKQIDDARVAADAAIEAVADEGSYENELDEAAIQDAIDAIEPRAALDKAQNEAADLDKALEDALATIAEEAADVKDEFTGAEIAADIEDLKNAIEEAGNNGTLVDNYASVMEPATAIADAIEALVADAKAAQADFEKEQARKDANDEAYRNDLEKLDDLQADLDRALQEIADEYPDYDPTTAKDEIQQAIDDARAAADAENENVADEGDYTSQIDSDTITDMIEEMINEAKNSGIESIYAEDIDGVTAIYTLDGVRHQRAIKGQINVLVKNDGSKIKVYVK